MRTKMQVLSGRKEFPEHSYAFFYILCDQIECRSMGGCIKEARTGRNDRILTVKGMHLRAL
jgi:hypothetical protein